ncbi:MAG: hypothetical protein H7Y11_10965, partial [Armatimonadetes bacterium]|nr:hypothetical protein [Anaerolineae bacterium]
MKQAMRLWVVIGLLVLMLPLVAVSARQGTDLPEPVQIALDALSAKFNNDLDGDIDLTSGLETYRFNEVLSLFTEDCEPGGRTGFARIEALHY